MSILDIAVLVVIALCVLFGCYRGFFTSALKAASFFVSWILAYLIHPLLSWLLGTDGVIRTLVNYTEGAAKLKMVSMEQAFLPVSSVDPSQLNDIVSKSSLVSPFTNMVKQNITAQNLADKGLTTVGEYFDYTVAYATLNIISFILLFIVFRLILGLLINLMDATHPLPVLKHYDTLMGGLMGALRGFFGLYLVGALVPVALSVFNMTDAVLQGAPLLRFFYQSNFILLLMRGTIL